MPKLTNIKKLKHAHITYLLSANYAKEEEEAKNKVTYDVPLVHFSLLLPHVSPFNECIPETKSKGTSKCQKCFMYAFKLTTALLGHQLKD